VSSNTAIVHRVTTILAMAEKVDNRKDQGDNEEQEFECSEDRISSHDMLVSRGTCRISLLETKRPLEDEVKVAKVIDVEIRGFLCHEHEGRKPEDDTEDVEREDGPVIIDYMHEQGSDHDVDGQDYGRDGGEQAQGESIVIGEIEAIGAHAQDNDGKDELKGA